MATEAGCRSFGHSVVPTPSMCPGSMGERDGDRRRAREGAEDRGQEGHSRGPQREKQEAFRVAVGSGQASLRRWRVPRHRDGSGVARRGSVTGEGPASPRGPVLSGGARGGQAAGQGRAQGSSRGDVTPGAACRAVTWSDGGFQGARAGQAEGDGNPGREGRGRAQSAHVAGGQPCAPTGTRVFRGSVLT